MSAFTDDFYETNAIDTESVIREAFRRIWKRATNQPRETGERSLMSVPVDRENDADFIMGRALDELFYLRKANDKIQTLERERDEARELAKEFHDELKDEGFSTGVIRLPWEQPTQDEKQEGK